LNKTPSLDLPLHAYIGQIRRREGQLWDPTRRKWLVAEPEEVVRQALILFLEDALDITAARMRTEYEIRVQSMRKRLDLILYDGSGEAFLLAECKSWEVALSEKVLQQIGNYNTQIQAPFLLVTNGTETLLCHAQFDTKSSSFLRSMDFVKIHYEKKR
jgi:hypothetical protein